jgi:hypothetical protein
MSLALERLPPTFLEVRLSIGWKFRLFTVFGLIEAEKSCPLADRLPGFLLGPPLGKRDFSDGDT